MTSPAWSNAACAKLASPNGCRYIHSVLVLLRQAMNELLTEIQWANRNRDAGPDDWRAVRTITSMPVDPAAPD